jgi:hypothetical protein
MFLTCSTVKRNAKFMQFLCVSAKALTDKMKGFDRFLNIHPVRRFLNDLLQNAKLAPLFYLVLSFNGEITHPGGCAPFGGYSGYKVSDNALTSFRFSILKLRISSSGSIFLTCANLSKATELIPFHS